MKSKFSTKWKASSQPRKQRKYLANAPLHLRRKFVNVNLSKDLRKKQKKRSIQIKKGDKVKIMRGKFKGEVRNVVEVNLKKSKVIVEGIQVKKMDGSKVNIKLQPSNLQIIELSERLKKTESKPAEIKNSLKKIKTKKAEPNAEVKK